MRKFALVCSLVSFACIGSSAYAAEVEVSWQQPEKYTDIKPTNESHKAYQERVLKHFDGIFADLASKLPEGYSWTITVSDLDLAGDIDPFAGRTGQGIRIVKELYSPAIKFNHILQDKYGEQIINQDEQLRDLGFMQTIHSAQINKEFYYEQQMLQRWFERSVLPKVAAAQSAAAKVSSN